MSDPKAGRSRFQPLAPHLEASLEVNQALTEGRPVVALESTIIAHGMPFPENVETALAVESIIRRNGALPATVAVIDGKARVGCSAGDIERLALSRQDTGNAAHKVAKASLRDLPVLYACGGTGATTVAATAFIAARAGVRVFVTGGIGGVHRGWEETLDISSDLEVLGRVTLAVVCAGAKTVLDVGATLEYLETAGVTVVGLGTDEFPAFYTRSTGYPVDARVERPEEAAGIFVARVRAGLPGSVLVAVPIPEEHELPAVLLNRALEEALTAARAAGVSGKALTPYLLEAVREATGGQSLGANIALIKSNASAGAALAARVAGRLREAAREGERLS